ncbi:MAG: hypothetical protein B6D34_09975 [Candidatus Brocadia sp. UTAMX1]|nr:MAG: hypothetical protein B6D34_09975 [Candidatus Brocadia sp. UTAMX1]
MPASNLSLVFDRSRDSPTIAIHTQKQLFLGMYHRETLDMKGEFSKWPVAPTCSPDASWEKCENARIFLREKTRTKSGKPTRIGA